VAVQASLEAADHILPDAQIDNAEGTVTLRGAHRAINLHLETQLPGDRKTRRLNRLETLQGQAGADEIRAQALLFEAIANGAGNNAPALACFLSKRKKSQLGVSDACFVWRDAELSAQVIEGDAVNITIGQIEESAKI